MKHEFIFESAEALTVIDALKMMKDDEQINPEDRINARSLLNRIIDQVCRNIRERGNDGSKDISGEGWQD